MSTFSFVSLGAAVVSALLGGGLIGWDLFDPPAPSSPPSSTGTMVQANPHPTPAGLPCLFERRLRPPTISARR